VGARTFPQIEQRLLLLAQKKQELFFFSAVAVSAAFVFAVLDHFRRLRPPAVPAYLRMNRALAYGVVLATALEAFLVTRAPDRLTALLHSLPTQGLALLLIAVLSVVSYGAWLHPLFEAGEGRSEAYQLAVERMKNTYDFVLGIRRPSDWKLATTGARDWLTMPENALWTNLGVFGGIGSGKTSALAYPIIKQAMGKYPDDASLRPSIILLDLKGDLALRSYQFAKKLGRKDEFWVISPGNALLDEREKPILDDKGRPIIPLDRFLSWNPIGGTAPADIRAAQLLDGLAATSEGVSKSSASEYFENVEREFLSATVQLFDAVHGPGRVNLLDIYLFAYDAVRRKEIVNSERAKGTPAQLYFQKRFGTMDAKDQGTLISGLTAQLAKLTSPTVQKTFCPQEGDGSKQFPGFTELCINKPGIIVFSVPSEVYSAALCRVLGIVFMRAFHNAALKRSTTQFAETGGNTKRLLLQVTDECWAFMNKGVADFTAVSRQARTCSMFLSQSLEQISDAYRSTFEGNFRTKVLLGVNDTLTLQRFEQLFGQVKELVTNTSASQSLNDVRHGVFTQSVDGRNQGLSQSTNTSERLVPRFSQTEIQHLPPNRAIVHMFDGQSQNQATAFEVTPYYRLAFSLFAPLEHIDVGCPAEGRRTRHTLVSDGPGFRCTSCGHKIAGQAAEDLRAYEQAFPQLMSASSLSGSSLSGGAA
jgi:type IV secretory pathway TraG/TraD family ATPase VirD4